MRKCFSIMLRHLLVLVFILAISLPHYGQNTISGTITSELGDGLPNATAVLTGTSIGSESDSNGRYRLKNIPEGNYELVVSFVGYQTVKKTVSTSDMPLVVDFVLYKSVNSLDEVVVTGKSSSQLIRETPYLPDVIDMKNTHATTVPVIDVVGQLPGVRIRQQGGLGSDINLSLNGISGKGIRTFVDGIPVDLLGYAFRLNNISSHVIERIDVYKGLVPVKFGADALGGVVNIQTVNRYHNHTEVSYSLGSWNTHQASVGAKRYFDRDKKHFLQVDGYFNYSDNNYWMYDVDIIVDKLGNTKKGKARRFNDTFQSLVGRVQYGLQDMKWADDFRVGLSFSKSKKEWQHGISAELPWGEVFSSSNGFNSFVSWKKYGKNDRWKFSAVLGYNSLYEDFTDVAPNKYLWDGTAFATSGKGESGYYIEGRTPKITTDNIFGRITANYQLNSQHQLNLTSLTTYEQVEGEDKAGAANFQKDIYTTPQKLTKSFVGASLQSSLIGRKLVNVLSSKWYYADSYVASLKEDNTIDNFINNNQQVLGYGDVIKYQFSKKISATVGYEYSVRLPDKEEIFGNGISIGPSAKLKMETSHNINMGIESQSKLTTFSINGFFRKTNNKIFLTPVTRGFSTHLNLFATSTKGINASCSFQPLPHLATYMNATWQRITLLEVDHNSQVEERFIGAKIPNIPYLFANMGVTYTFRDLMLDKSKLILGYNSKYVHEFFLTWESDGLASTKAVIPTQYLHNASLTYTFPKEKYSLSIECRNLTNTLAYDNYKAQKAGRSFYLKLRMMI